MRRERMGDKDCLIDGAGECGCRKDGWGDKDGVNGEGGSGTADGERRAGLLPSASSDAYSLIEEGRRRPLRLEVGVGGSGVSRGESAVSALLGRVAERRGTGGTSCITASDWTEERRDL